MKLLATQDPPPGEFQSLWVQLLHLFKIHRTPAKTLHYEAARALKALGPLAEPAIAKLGQELAKDPDPVFNPIVRDLITVGAHAIPALASQLCVARPIKANSFVLDAFYEMVYSDPQESTVVLFQLGERGDSGTKAAAVELLGCMAGELPVRPLLVPETPAGTNVLIRALTIRALSRLNLPRQTLMPIVRHGLEDTNEIVRHAAESALTNIERRLSPLGH